MFEIDVTFVATFALAAVAGLMRGFAGFGSAMVLSPIFAIVYGPAQAVLMIAAMEIVVSVQLAPKALADVQWRFLVPLVAAALVGMPFGAWVLATADPALIARAIAAIVLAFVVVLAVGWRYEGPKRLVPTLGVGGAAGALLTATSVGGPPVLLYMLSSRDTARTNRANIILFFAITEVVTPFFLYLQSLFAWTTVLHALALCPAYLVGAWVGGRLFRTSSETLYRRVALVFLAAIALYALFR